MIAGRIVSLLWMASQGMMIVGHLFAGPSGFHDHCGKKLDIDEHKTAGAVGEGDLSIYPVNSSEQELSDVQGTRGSMLSIRGVPSAIFAKSSCSGFNRKFHSSSLTADGTRNTALSPAASQAMPFAWVVCR